MEIVRTPMIVKIETAVPRLWTDYPPGLTVAAEEYDFLDFEVSNVAITADGSPVAIQISIPNAQNLSTDLVTLGSNRGAPVTVQQVELDDAGAIVELHPYFTGLLGKPAWRGPWLMIACAQHFGRRGQTPTVEWSEVMHSHTPPDPETRIPWLVR